MSFTKRAWFVVPTQCSSQRGALWHKRYELLLLQLCVSQRQCTCFTDLLIESEHVSHAFFIIIVNKQRFISFISRLIIFPISVLAIKSRSSELQNCAIFMLISYLIYDFWLYYIVSCDMEKVPRRSCRDVKLLDHFSTCGTYFFDNIIVKLSFLRNRTKIYESSKSTCWNLAANLFSYVKKLWENLIIYLGILYSILYIPLVIFSNKVSFLPHYEVINIILIILIIFSNKVSFLPHYEVINIIFIF